MFDPAMAAPMSRWNSRKILAATRVPREMLPSRVASRRCCIIPDKPKGVSNLRFTAKIERVNRIKDLPVFMQQRPYVAVAPGALHVSRFFTVEAWAGFGGSTIEVGANFIAHNGKSYTREHTTPYYRAEYIVR